MELKINQFHVETVYRSKSFVNKMIYALKIINYGGSNIRDIRLSNEISVGGGKGMIRT
jgi:hypothetical protein